MLLHSFLYLPISPLNQSWMQIYAVHFIMLSNDGKPVSRDTLYNLSEKLVVKNPLRPSSLSPPVGEFSPLQRWSNITFIIIDFLCQVSSAGTCAIKLRDEILSVRKLCSHLIHNIFIFLRIKGNVVIILQKKIHNISAFFCYQCGYTHKTWGLTIRLQRRRMGKWREIIIRPYSYLLQCILSILFDR